MIESWSIPGSDGYPILGDTHHPAGDSPGSVIIAHGFKGYKDYGFIPVLARGLCDAGFTVHRFNFSHSGMTNRVDTFERPDLFERDTWNRQVFDLRTVIEAVRDGRLERSTRPCVLFGHSRGGVTCLLTAGRFADDSSFPRIAGIVTAAAPSETCNLSESERTALRSTGFIESPSARTGQRLRIGRAWLDEQEQDSPSHDLRQQIARIGCPILVLHGEDDPTVGVAHADAIARAARNARLIRIAGADHVFNTPNPAPMNGPMSTALKRVIEETIAFARQVAS